MVASLYSVAEEQKAIWIFLEQKSGKLESVSLELLTKGRQLADQAGWQLSGFLMGNSIAQLAQEAIA
jgi:electron transfer flavoprotein alpha subunit